ncbi:hypothetical protein CEXT_406881 [Caerostris extrusa]|uniref:Uncharacterized protein n=1 Tax=Caerostris extrusa TaxID=172846 RepID=A0AAV4XV22_CAEEX|nr:hypothetical protein CEXT_406881 [Caerostris extrusa]
MKGCFPQSTEQERTLQSALHANESEIAQLNELLGKRSLEGRIWARRHRRMTVVEKPNCIVDRSPFDRFRGALVQEDDCITMAGFDKAVDPADGVTNSLATYSAAGIHAGESENPLLTIFSGRALGASLAADDGEEKRSAGGRVGGEKSFRLEVPYVTGCRNTTCALDKPVSADPLSPPHTAEQRSCAIY